MSVYLDTSALVALFIESDAFATRARSFTVEDTEALVVSDFAAAEFVAVIARLMRMNLITSDKAREIFDQFDTWRMRFASDEPVDPTDIRVAATIIRRLDLNIRAPDAINPAIALRLGASVATFDQGMEANARTLGLDIALI